MSPKSGGRAQRRQRRNMIISVLVVVGIAIGTFAATSFASWSPRLGLDLAGGVSVVYTAEGQHVSQSDLNETVNILNLRVNGLGVSGAQVQTTGNKQISVSIPGVTNAQQVLQRDRPDGAHVFPPGRVLGRSAGGAETLEDRSPSRGSRRSPPASRRRKSRQSSLNVQPDSTAPAGLHLEPRATRSPSTRRIPRPAPKSRTTPTAPCCSRASTARATRETRRCAACSGRRR